jgi:hypothetical protein
MEPDLYQRDFKCQGIDEIDINSKSLIGFGSTYSNCFLLNTVLIPSNVVRLEYF